MGRITDVLDDEGGIYGRNPEIREDVFEKEYARFEHYINFYSNPIAAKTTDPLLADIEKIVQLPGGRQLFEGLVKEIDQKTRKYLRKLKKSR